MPKVAPFYSLKEVSEQVQNRVHHNNSACPVAREIPEHERKPGTEGYRLCVHCFNLNNQGR